MSIGPEAKAEDDSIVFQEQWHVQVLALANVMAEAGVFTREAWSNALGAALRRRPEPPGESEPFYYECVLEALEQLLNEAGSVNEPELATRIDKWRKAYLNTRHGDPVELSNADTD